MCYKTKPLIGHDALLRVVLGEKSESPIRDTVSRGLLYKYIKVYLKSTICK